MLDLKSPAKGTPQTYQCLAPRSDQDGATGTRVSLLLKITKNPDKIHEIMVSRN